MSTPAATPGAPPTFGTAKASGPIVSAATFAEAEKLAQVTMSPAEREMAAASWRQSLAPLLERRVGPRTMTLEPQVAPATRWNPVLAGQRPGPGRNGFVRSTSDSAPLPANDADIAAVVDDFIDAREMYGDAVRRAVCAMANPARDVHGQ